MTIVAIIGATLQAILFVAMLAILLVVLPVLAWDITVGPSARLAAARARRREGVHDR